MRRPPPVPYDEVKHFDGHQRPLSRLDPLLRDPNGKLLLKSGAGGRSSTLGRSNAWAVRGTAMYTAGARFGLARTEHRRSG